MNGSWPPESGLWSSTRSCFPSWMMEACGSRSPKPMLRIGRGSVGRFGSSNVRGALTARTPLDVLGITWVAQDGPSTQHQEIRWTWDPDTAVIRYIAGGGP